MPRIEKAVASQEKPYRQNTLKSWSYHFFEDMGRRREQYARRLQNPVRKHTL